MCDMALLRQAERVHILHWLLFGLVRHPGNALGDMLGHDRTITPEQVGHLPPGQPDHVPGQPDIHAHGAVRGVVDDDLPTQGLLGSCFDHGSWHRTGGCDIDGTPAS